MAPTMFLIGFLASPLLVLLYRQQHLLLFLISSNRQASLRIATNSLAPFQITLIFVSLICKALLQLVGLRSSVASVAKRQERTGKDVNGVVVEKGAMIRLEDASLVMPLRISTGDLRKYLRVIGDKAAADDLESLQRTFQTSGGDRTFEEVSHHHLLFFSAISEPAMLLLLAKQNCAIQPLGVVNVRNRFELLELKLATECVADVLEGRTVSTPEYWKHWSVIATCRPGIRRVKRGFEIDFSVEVVKTEAGGLSVVVYRQVFTMLQFARHSRNAVLSTAIDAQDGLVTERRSGAGVAVKISANAPRQWASLCKDYNPIHISSLAAKLFGFPSVIAHGALVVARSLAALHKQRADSASSRKGEHKPMWMEMQFRRPVVVPTTLEVRLYRSLKFAFDSEVEVSRQGKLHVTFQMGPLAKQSRDGKA